MVEKTRIVDTRCTNHRDFTRERERHPKVIPVEKTWRAEFRDSVTLSAAALIARDRAGLCTAIAIIRCTNQQGVTA